jgi:cyclopropane fatty-acyl-phospholipid synthase-like methyltransferase
LAAKPFSTACERNQDPILDVLREHLADRKSVLEIGSGTGQHAVYFATHLPQLTWQTSDRVENHPGINAWLEDSAPTNVMPPLPLDVATGPWPTERYDAIFSANTLHIMRWEEVVEMFARLPAVLRDDAKLVVYGPFNYAGEFTSASNAAFDRSLKAAEAYRGIRDFEVVNALAATAGLHLVEDRAMPANNRCLVWQRISENF